MTNYNKLAERLATENGRFLYFCQKLGIKKKHLKTTHSN